METSRRSWHVRNWRIDLARTVALGLGSLGALTAAGWPDNGALAAWVGLGGAVVGLAIALGVEYVLRLRAEVLRLQAIERQLVEEQRMRKQERELREYQLMLANRRAAVAEVGVSVWGGAFNEINPKSASPMPVEVIMARHEVELKAKGLDKPPPPPPGSQERTQ